MLKKLKDFIFIHIIYRNSPSRKAYYCATFNEKHKTPTLTENDIFFDDI